MEVGVLLMLVGEKGQRPRKWVTALFLKVLDKEVNFLCYKLLEAQSLNLVAFRD